MTLVLSIFDSTYVLIYIKSKGDNSDIQNVINILMPPRPTSFNSAADEIEDFLIKGDKLGACEIAVSNEQWTHAMIIARRLGEEVYQSIVTKFTMSEISNGRSTPSLDMKGTCLPAILNFFSGRGPTAGKVAKNMRSGLS